MNGFSKFLTAIGPVRLFAALGVTAIAAALLFATVFRMGGEEKALLFSDVDVKEAAEITAKLDGAKIEYELRGDGSSIFVPRSQVMDARMMLSADGLPSRGSVGYEIFDTQDALGATQFQQNIQRLRALEGELARTIVSLDGVERARVHLVLPEKRLFERDSQQPTASIVLTMRGDVTPGQVRAVRNLVAGAVPNLSPERVTVLDSDGRLLADGASEGGSFGPDGVDIRQTAAEERIRRTVQDIVEGVVGPGGARVQVTAEMDFNRITQNSETFDPEGRVVRSTQTVEETGNSQEQNAEGGSSAARNVPDGAGGGANAANTSTTQRNEETVNYEISKTTKTEIIEGGRLRKISVAVAVDGVTTPAAEGQEAQWAPRDPQELERIATLVRSAVGYDEARGDKVEVVNVRFAKPPAAQGSEAADPSPFDLRPTDMMRGGEILAALIAALAMVFFVLRPLVAGLIKPPAGASAPSGTLVAQSLSGGEALAVGSSAQAALPAPDPEADRVRIDLARIKGKVSDSSVKQVSEIVEAHPDESLSILRGWLTNSA